MRPPAWTPRPPGSGAWRARWRTPSGMPRSAITTAIWPVRCGWRARWPAGRFPACPPRRNCPIRARTWPTGRRTSTSRSRLLQHLAIRGTFGSSPTGGAGEKAGHMHEPRGGRSAAEPAGQEGRADDDPLPPVCRPLRAAHRGDQGYAPRLVTSPAEIDRALGFRRSGRGTGIVFRRLLRAARNPAHPGMRCSRLLRGVRRQAHGGSGSRAGSGGGEPKRGRRRIAPGSALPGLLLRRTGSPRRRGRVCGPNLAAQLQGSSPRKAPPIPVSCDSAYLW